MFGRRKKSPEMTLTVTEADTTVTLTVISSVPIHMRPTGFAIVPTDRKNEYVYSRERGTAKLSDIALDVEKWMAARAAKVPSMVLRKGEQLILRSPAEVKLRTHEGWILPSD